MPLRWSRVLEKAPRPQLVRRKKNVRNRFPRLSPFLPESFLVSFFFLLCPLLDGLDIPVQLYLSFSVAFLHPLGIKSPPIVASRAPLQTPNPPKWLQIKRLPTPSRRRATRPLQNTTGPPQWTFITRQSRNMIKNRLSFATAPRYVGTVVLPHPQP